MNEREQAKFFQQDVNIDHQQGRVGQQQDTTYQKLYKQLLDLSQKEDRPMSAMALKFLSNSIVYSQEVFKENIQITVLQRMNNCQALKLAVSYGNFTLNINLINIDQNSPVNNKQELTKGYHGFVYEHKHQNGHTALKFIRIHQPFQLGIRQVIKQYLFLAVASATRVGPQLIRFFSFDLLVFRDYFAFSMEYCPMRKYQINESLQNLKQKLRLFHRLKIVHLDIKPDNIGFSLRNNEYIFIDFGLSRIVKEQIKKASYTHFVGSFNYCSPEMLQLFQNQTSGYINLYYNDAFCLNQSIKSIKSQLQIQNQKTQIIQSSLTKTLSNLSAKLKTKLLFFEASLKFYSQRCYIRLKQIFDNSLLQSKETIRKNRLQFIKFIANLEQSAQLIYVYKIGLKNILQGNEIHTYDLSIKLINQSENRYENIFCRRFKAIKYNNYYSINNEFSPLSDNIFDVENASQMKKSFYTLKLITYIKINNEVLQFSQKIKACLVYRELYRKDLGNIKDLQLYKQTIKHIFQNAIQCDSKQDSEILFHSIESAFILELVTQQQLIKALQHILSSELELLCKLNLFFRFIESLQFIGQKYKTNYNYDRVKEAFMDIYLLFIGKVQLQVASQQDGYIIKHFKSVFSLKELARNKPHYHNQIRHILYTFQTIYLNNQTKHLKRLAYSIISYAIYIYANIQLEQNHVLSEKTLIFILFTLNASHTFSYLHFFLYNLAYFQNQNTYNKQIFERFREKFSHFQEFEHFNIYLINKLILIKEIKIIKHKQNNPQVGNCQVRQDEFFQQIIDKFSFIIKNSPKFHKYLRYFLVLMTIENSSVCWMLMKKLILSNRQQILKLSLTSEHSPSLHQNQLMKQIFVINNILQILSTALKKDLYLDQAYKFMQKCQQTLKDVQCFKCKVYGLLQMYKGFTNIIQNQQKIQQSFLLLIDLITFCIKHHQLMYSAVNMLTSNLIFVWRKSNILFQKYDIRFFIYDIISTKKIYMYCLVDLRYYNLFVNLYCLVEQMQDQDKMGTFFKNILKGLSLQRSTNFIRNFFCSWSLIVKQRKKQQINLLTNHRLLIQYFLEHLREPVNNHYCILYFLPLLQVQSIIQYHRQMLLAIARSLNYLEHYPKNLIFNRYYYQFNKYFDSRKRKSKFLTLRHLKKKYDKSSLKFIFKKKLKYSSNSLSLFEQKINALKLHIKRYHKNIGNLI